MSGFHKPKPIFKVWLETDEGFVFGPGVYSILRKVEETGTLKDAAEALDMSYRFAWGLVKKAERKIGEPLLVTHKGGRAGGGGTELTRMGRQFLEDFSRVEALMNRLSRDPSLIGSESIEQRFEATILEIEETEDLSQVIIETPGSRTMKLSLKNEDVDSLDLGVGDRVRIELTSILSRIEKL